MFTNPWVVDIEVFLNCFTVVGRKLDSKEYVTFRVHEDSDVNEMPLFIEWLNTRPTIIGYNTIDFDSQIIEWIWRKGGNVTSNEIYLFKEDVIKQSDADRFNMPYSEWDFTFKTIDLFKINHYDSRKVSLKWLEFTCRLPKMADLPVAHDQPISKSKLIDLVRYNKKDVNATYDFYYKCLPMVELRYDLHKQLNEARVLNMSDSSFGSFIFEKILVNEHKMDKRSLKRGSRDYKDVKGSDILLDYLFFNSPEFQTIHENFKAMVYEDVHESGLKSKEYEHSCLFQDMIFVFGSGGLHACYKSGEYNSDDDHVIMSIDVKSYYPNLAIANQFYPAHIGKSFCDIYKKVYDTRGTYAKGTAMNYAYKIALNSVYGKSNSTFSLFYDPKYTVSITVNGQMLLAMLAEQLSSMGRLLMVNTDGIEIRIPRSKVKDMQDFCDQWEMITGLELEANVYSKLVIKDVNNYIAIDTEGTAKRKGMLEMYEDITEEGGKPHSYHKSPNATIIPTAIYEYYVNDVPIYDTIMKENNIFEFCFGIKKQQKFEYWLITADDGVIDIEKRDDRVLRYFISPDGANIYKFWKDKRKNNIQGVNRGQLVSLAMNIGNTDILRLKKIPKTDIIDEIIQYNVNKSYYIEEANKIIDLISVGSRDTAYQKYIKNLPKEI